MVVELMKEHERKIILRIVFVAFLLWIQVTEEDWKYWTPLLHGGFLTLLATGAGAWIGTLRTEKAALKAAEFAGTETRKAMREQVEAQARIAEEKEQMALAQEVSVYIRDFCSGVSKLMECWDGSKCKKDDEISMLKLELPIGILAKIIQLRFLDADEKKWLLILCDMIQDSIVSAKKQQGIGVSCIDDVGKIRIGFLYEIYCKHVENTIKPRDEIAEHLYQLHDNVRKVREKIDHHIGLF